MKKKIKINFIKSQSMMANTLLIALPKPHKQSMTICNIGNAAAEKLAPNSPIIREQFERDDLLKVRNPRPIKLVTIRTLIYETLLKAGITEREHRTEGQTPGKVKKNISFNTQSNISFGVIRFVFQP